MNNAANPIGKITPPVAIAGDGLAPLVKIMNVGLQVVLLVAGIWCLVNFIRAGFNYMTAGGDSKKISEANTKMTMTVIGLAIIVATPIIAMIIGMVFFGDPTAILNPKIKGI